MFDVVCPGLPAPWVNGWLAAVGATVLNPRLRLRWTADTTPVAVLAGEVDPVAALSTSWPDRALLSDLPIAMGWEGVGEMRRRVAVEVFARRARVARGHPYSWTLSSTMTDLCVDKTGAVAHGPLDPAGPGTTKWLHHRLTRVWQMVTPPSAGRIGDSLAGRAVRVKANGLGFDHTRLGSLADDTMRWVDPVIEVLAFFGLSLFPVRGPASDERLRRTPAHDVQQRGWLRTDGGRRFRFTWPAWRPALDAAGVDALLDVWDPRDRASWPRTGVVAGWQSVHFVPRGSSDTTRGFGSERL